MGSPPGWPLCTWATMSGATQSKPRQLLPDCVYRGSGPSICLFVCPRIPVFKSMGSSSSPPHRLFFHSLSQNSAQPHPAARELKKTQEPLSSSLSLLTRAFWNFCSRNLPPPQALDRPRAKTHAPRILCITTLCLLVHGRTSLISCHPCAILSSRCPRTPARASSTERITRFPGPETGSTLHLSSARRVGKGSLSSQQTSIAA